MEKPTLFLRKRVGLVRKKEDENKKRRFRGYGTHNMLLFFIFLKTIHDEKSIILIPIGGIYGKIKHVLGL